MPPTSVLLLTCDFLLQAFFTIVLIRYRNIVIKEGVKLDPNAFNDIDKNLSRTTASPRVIYKDINVPVSLTPSVSV